MATKIKQKNAAPTKILAKFNAFITWTFNLINLYRSFLTKAFDWRHHYCVIYQCMNVTSVCVISVSLHFTWIGKYYEILWQVEWHSYSILKVVTWLYVIYRKHDVFHIWRNFDVCTSFYDYAPINRNNHLLPVVMYLINWPYTEYGFNQLML